MAHGLWCYSDCPEGLKGTLPGWPPQGVDAWVRVMAARSLVAVGGAQSRQPPPLQGVVRVAVLEWLGEQQLMDGRRGPLVNEETWC